MYPVQIIRMFDENLGEATVAIESNFLFLLNLLNKKELNKLTCISIIT